MVKFEYLSLNFDKILMREGSNTSNNKLKMSLFISFCVLHYIIEGHITLSVREWCILVNRILQ